MNGMKTFQTYIYCLLSYGTQYIIMLSNAFLGYSSFVIVFCMGFDAVSVCVSLHYKASVLPVLDSSTSKLFTIQMTGIIKCMEKI